MLAVATRDVSRLAVLPRVVTLRPRIRAVAYQKRGIMSVLILRELWQQRKGGGVVHMRNCRRTECEGDSPVDELAGEAAVAVEDVAPEEVLRGALTEGRKAWGKPIQG